MSQGLPSGSFPSAALPTVKGEFGEETLVELPAIALIEGMDWEVVNLHHEWASGKSTERRETDHEVILVERLRAALAELNPTIPLAGLEQAIEQLTRDRSKLVPVNANEEFYGLLKSGVPIKLTDERGGETAERVRVIDWRAPENNRFLLASQFWVSGDVYKRRCDLVGFVNGIPLVLFELKATHKVLKSAYDENITDYRYAVPQLFVPNSFVVLSNGSNTVLGGSFAAWEEFVEWKRINDEGEKGVVSLETAIRGTCTQTRLLDIVENFIVFEKGKEGVVKKIAKNHQYLGVNRAIEEVKRLGENRGRLGVFWHTQGSGKSLSMLYFSQKILRTLRGNWTFVVVTDRDELDGQIYKTFAATGAVTEAEGQAHAASARHLQRLLREDHRYIFTLIHKFRTESGTPHTALSERSDIIVITDEAHRTQYDTLALNMRNALPNAAFIGFTGTPLVAGEEKTREVFGDYVSVYNFTQSIADGATVALYYENRIPELQLTNTALRDDLDQLLEDAELDEAQERNVEQEFAREYHLVTRDDRLEKVAEDIVEHFMGRGHRGKAMVICIDKATAVRMYDKVKLHWSRYLDKLRAELGAARDDQREPLAAKIAEMERTDMAVVVSQGQNEVKDLAEKGLDIRPHRKRIVTEKLDEKFKDADDPLRLVFVCAMWITGFDVPSCSTIYLDKPMKNHTLMQTIARANRTFPGKEAGLIVDYVGVFRNLQKALAIYGATRGDDGDSPIKDKAALVEHLKHLVAEAVAFCTQRGIDTEAIKAAKGFQKVGLLDDAVEALISTDDDRDQFLSLATTVARVYRAILPDPVASEVAPEAVLLSVLAEKIRALAPPPDISHVMSKVEELLDRSVAADAYVLPTGSEQSRVDLSKIDFEALQRKFGQSRKRTEAEKLRALIMQKLARMVSLNPSRADFLERFQKLIDAYNAGSQNIEAFFAELVKLAQNLNEEERRSIREGLTEEELALFDILTKPEPDLTEKEKAEVKKVCKALLETLKAEKLVLDWRSKPQARAAVRQTIEVVLDALPKKYDEAIYERKCDATYRHVYDCYYGGSESLYAG